MCISGYVYVDLRSEEEVNKALKKNKDYIGDKYFLIYISVYIFFSVLRGCSSKKILHRTLEFFSSASSSVDVRVILFNK